MMSTIEQMNYTDGDEAAKHPCLRRLAAADPALLRSAREPATPRRGARALAGAVPRAAPDQAGPRGPAPARARVLHLMNAGRPIPRGELAETLACDASNVTGLVDRLESRGLGGRRASARDRRGKGRVLPPT